MLYTMSKYRINVLSRFSGVHSERGYGSAIPIVKPLILGIETSCDDTGAAIVDRNGNVLGESLRSQQSLHLRYGGIIPPFAQEMHRQNIERVVSETFTKANLTPNDLDAIAVTNRPGLAASLAVGVRYAKHLSRSYASGGHCILALIKGVQEFYMLGETVDVAPGKCFDKIARRLKIRHLPEYEWMNGGQAIETAASRATNPNQFEFPLPMSKYKDCQFSFSGFKNSVNLSLLDSERKHNVPPGEIIPDYENFSAGLLKAFTRHICHRTQRAMEIAELQGFINACNNFIFDALKELCDQLGYQIWRPIKPHCMDNGLMIAWNDIERWLENEDIYRNINLDEVVLDKKCPLGKSLVNEVSSANLKCKWVKISSLKLR